MNDRMHHPETRTPAPVEKSTEVASVKIVADLAGIVGHVRASADPIAVVHNALLACAESAHAAGIRSALMSKELKALLHQRYEDGILAGRQQIEIGADAAKIIATTLADAIAAAPPPVVHVSAPNVNVAAPAVTVENTVEVPQRAMSFTPDGRGGVIARPTDG